MQDPSPSPWYRIRHGEISLRAFRLTTDRSEFFKPRRLMGGNRLLSFVMFLAPDPSGAPPRVFALLAVMHVTAVVVIVGVLTRATGPVVVSR